jgi:hypothetical protein
LRGDVLRYVAQEIPQIDPGEICYAFHKASTEIVEKVHLWMEGNEFASLKIWSNRIRKRFIIVFKLKLENR